MSKVISFRDLLVAEELAGYKEMDLLHIKMDKLVNSILAQVGFDIDYPIVYIPSNHRDMQNKVGVGYQAVGEISVNSAYLNSSMSTVTERMVAAAYRDTSLAIEMASLTGSVLDYDSFKGEDDTSGDNDFPDELIEPDFNEVSQQLRLLQDIRDDVRGPMFNESGDLKTAEEYAEYLHTLRVVKSTQ